ncbi:outer membrane beta-barrel protein [Photobacterium sanguinicancri]|uniref:outer membrane beta-barrel protein n=1 Tax=Photobacterium sanguinicancri TaxID=875932 RepID=UPI0026E34389|nr:outer membrane beta-barrel protein [Photobacterium sanguinicancri]MDO6498911.1 outer membrane beta-barrel protein [Photobacterium sanguinicancri]
MEHYAIKRYFIVELTIYMMCIPNTEKHRYVMTKIIKIIFLALLFSSYHAHASMYIGSKLGFSDIDYNQELNTDQSSESPSEDADIYGGFGIDIGWVSDMNRYRIFYTFEQFDSETERLNSADKIVMKTSDSISQHLLNAEYLFLSQRNWNPYVGIHVGFHQRETIDSSNDCYNFTSSGLTYGAQTGIVGRIGRHFSLDFGMRLSVLNSSMSNTNNQSNNTFNVTNSMLTVVYFGANYRF